LANNIFSRKDEERPKRILVPVKGVAVDDEAMRLAYTYALAKKGKGRNIGVDVVYVVEVPHALPLDAQDEAGIEKGEKALDHAERAARELGLDVDASILQARSAGAAIVDMARESGSEMIVMAVPYHKKLGELDLGRTLPYVLKHAPCRVWVCRSAMGDGLHDTEGTGSGGGSNGGH
jgi:nucleotide-binding universal stress UspA family protein